VIRGMEGLGSSGHIHTTRILSLADNLPIMVIIIDTEPKIRAVVQQARNLAMELGAGMDALRFPGHQVHCRLRRGLPSRRHPDHQDPPQVPRANAICERIVGTLRREALDQMLIFNHRHLSKILAEYAEHYNEHRRTNPAVSDRPSSKPRSRGRSATWPTSARSSTDRSSTA
jgi:hypothetical protein